MSGILALVKSRLSVLAYLSAFDATLLVATSFKVSFIILLLSTVSVYSISLANYTLSDLMDVEEDKLNNPGRPLASGIVPKKDALAFIIFLLLLSFLTGFLINLEFDIFLTVSLISAFIYSAPRIRAKSRWYLKLLIAALGAFIAPFTVISITGFNIDVTLMSAIFMLWGLFTLNIGDLMDYEGDKKSGILSFAVIFGKERAVSFLKLLLIVQLISELLLLLNLNIFNVAYLSFVIYIFYYFFIKISEFRDTVEHRALAKELKKMTRISMIVLQVVTLSFLIQNAF